MDGLGLAATIKFYDIFTAALIWHSLARSLTGASQSQDDRFA